MTLTQDEPSQPGHVAVAVEKKAVGDFTIPPASAGFLIVALDRFREGGMDHKAHIGLIDPHSKCNGGTDNLEGNRTGHFMQGKQEHPGLTLAPSLVLFAQSSGWAQRSPSLATFPAHRPGCLFYHIAPYFAGAGMAGDQGESRALLGKNQSESAAN